MLARDRSLSTLLIASLVSMATVVLLIYATLNALVNRNTEINRLDNRVSLTTEQLQTSIAAALWTIDKPQVERVLDAAMKDRLVTAVVIKTKDMVYARSRDNNWKVIAVEPMGLQVGSITKELPIVFEGEQLGTITLMCTTKFLKQQVLTNSLFLVASILLLDVLLICCLYYVLSKNVLKPLKNIEKYAISVSSSDSNVPPLENYVFRGELEVLRASLEKMVSMLESRYLDLQREAKRFRESEQRNRILVNTIPDMVWLKDTKGVYLSCNKTFERFFGAAESSILGKTDYAFTDKELADSFREHDRKAMISGKPNINEEWITFADDGHRALLETTKVPLLDEEGKVVGVLGVGHDVTARKQAEDELIDALTYNRQIIECAQQGIIVYDLDLRYRVWNPFMEKMSGIHSSEVIGKTPLDVFPFIENSGVLERLKLVLKGEKVDSVEFPFHVESTGKSGWNSDTSAPLFNANGGIVGIIGVVQDLTEQRKTREQLYQAQKMESLGTLAGGVAHDMNNVLGAILGLASAQIATQAYGSPLHKTLETICKATERGGKMVKSLLSFARHTPAEVNLLDMNAILKEEVSLLERTTLAKVQIQLNLEPELLPIQGDAGALTHAFMNLCVNAVDAMPETGILTLTSRNLDRGWIEVVVEDNGMGMPREVLEKALDPFFTTKETGKGTGLGLSLVFSTVKAHRGQLEIESEPGAGTRVRLRFPACDEQTQAAVTEVAEALMTAKGTTKVMLVDDDELIQCSVQAILEALGYTAVTIAHSGEMALGLLEAGYDPDLVLLDMNMPGLGGAGTLTRLRGLRPHVPVFLSTGRVDQNAQQLALAHPGVTLLAKPFGLRELQRQMETIGLG